METGCHVLNAAVGVLDVIPIARAHARAIATWSHEVVYWGVRRSCFMVQTRFCFGAPALAERTVPLP
jgi:hypothetical protein